MGTLTALFNLSQTALTADQVALNATANNVANQNTPGYVRQVVSWQQSDAVTLGNGTSVGTGATASVGSKRDRILEQRVQQQTQTQAETAARANVLSQIESVFGITGSATTAGSTAIGTALNGFFSSLTALAANPSDATTRQSVLNSASTLASTFQSASASLSGVQATVGTQLASTTTQINSLTSTIAALNKRIGQTSPNGDAGTLEDQRQSAIAQLSQLVGLDQVQTESNGISLTTRGGTVLVLGSDAYALQATKTGATTTIQTAQGTDAGATIEGGSLGGLLQAQTVDLPATTAALDALAYRVATVVNAQNQAGLDQSSAAAGAIFAISSTATGAASAIAVSATGTGALGAAATGEGATGSGNANALASLASAVSGGVTISGQLAALLGQVGSTSSSLTEQNAAQTTSLTQLTTQRDSLSAVSLDEEAANLSRYQRSYQAASKLFQILDSLMAASINLGQQTTVA